MKVARRFPFVVSAVVLLSAVSIAIAQQDSKPAAKADAKAADGKTAKPRAKPRGRLPAYYSKVVDGQQREKIYAIQKQYEPKITALKAELQALQEKVDGEVAAVLTPEQQAMVKKLADDAKAKRKHAAGAGATASTDGEAEEEEGDEAEADEKAGETVSKTTGK
jgi:Spy/CpxP family protein refolding chaperone